MIRQSASRSPDCLIPGPDRDVPLYLRLVACVELQPPEGASYHEAPNGVALSGVKAEAERGNQGMS